MADLFSRSSSDESLSRYVEGIERAEGYNGQNQNDRDLMDLIDVQEVISPFKKRKFKRIRIEEDTDDDENEDNATKDVRIENQSTNNEICEIEDNESNSSVQTNKSSSSGFKYSSESSSESEYSSDSFICDDENSEEFDTETPNDYIDPRYLYDDNRANKKSRKINQRNSSENKVCNDESQEVSIHKINLNHYKFSSTCVENVMQKIIHEYNSRPEKKNKFNTKKVESRYRPIVKPEDVQHFEGEDFQVKVFVQKVPRTISLLNSYGIKEKATTIHSLIFHYRENELFAITTNQAWNVVQWCSDFEFPGKIAARILSKEGELESTNKGLVGTELIRRTTHKFQKKTNPYDLLTFCTRFTAELRENASILKLSCFQKHNLVSDPDPEVSPTLSENLEESQKEPAIYSKVKGVKVTVSLGNIRILKRFSTSDILSILSVLSKIAKGAATTDLYGEDEENSSTHKKYLTNVHTEVAKKLDIHLSTIIHDAIADRNKLYVLDNYQFCHKHTADFFNGYNFTLYYKDGKIKTFENEVPTIKQIVMELKEPLGEIRQGTSEENFLQQLNKVKICYDFGGRGKNKKTKKPEKFMNFIDGLLYHSGESSDFWHVSSMWCHVQEGYLYLVHTQFKIILNDCLIVDKHDPGYLEFPWPASDHRDANLDSKTKRYLAKYSSLEDAWISRKPGTGIIDMLKIGRDNKTGKKVLFGYYFLPGPNYKTSIKCNHVAESIMQIGKANSHMMGQNRVRHDDVAGSEDVRKQLQSIYSEVSQKRLFKEICPNFETFLKMVTRAKFILAIGREMSSGTDIPSLEKEKAMPTKITVNDIVDIFHCIIDVGNEEDIQMLKETARNMRQTFSKDRFLQLAESIHKLLQEQELLETGNSITGKMLSLSKNCFSVTNSLTVNEYLYEKIIYKFQPRVCTVLSKLGFIDMHKEIRKLTIKSFNIVEIPLDST